MGKAGRGRPPKWMTAVETVGKTEEESKVNIQHDSDYFF